MFVVCKTCSNSYHIPDAMLGDGPRRFRCSGCGRSWDVGPRETVAATVAATAASARGDWTRPADAAPARPAPRLLLRAAAARIAGPLAAAAALAAAMAAIGAREAIVAMLPPTASAYAAVGVPVNLRGLAIDNLRAELGEQEGKKILLVEGAVTNLREGETTAPPLRIALCAADGRELYVWTARTPKTRLASRESVRFVARLAAPPEGAAEALVKFVAPGDKVAGSAEGS
jgi:predicted Zn finger-like uncharacterized protein